MIQNISSNGSLWGSSVEKCHTTKKSESASSAVRRDFGGKIGVVEGIGAPDEAAAVF